MTVAEVVHRLGVALCLVVALAGAAWVVIAGRRERRARSRGRRIVGKGAEPQVSGPSRWRAAVIEWWPVAGVACAGYGLVGGVTGLLIGAVAGHVLRRWLSRRQASATPDLAQAQRQLPLAADLMTACIAAGAEPGTAARAVGESLDGPVAERLARAAAELRLGGEPERAWGQLAAIPGAGPLARCLERAGASGAPAAEQLAVLAADCRATWARSAAARARRASVVMAAPVGLCFLPAFLAVGVVPVVIGLAGGVLGGH